MIDAHQHFWRVERGDYGWLSADDPILYRDYEPAHLAPLLANSGIAQSVVVQAAPTVEETRYLLKLADATPWVAGVVGWVPLEAADVGDTLDDLAASGLLLGVRPMIQDLPDDEWMLDRALTRSWRAVAERGLRLDALVLPRHLPHLLRLLERHPELAVVIDHGGKPPIADGSLDAWADDIVRIARTTGACCKLSGLATEAGASDDWKTDDLRPYVDHLLEHFGTERLLWGSDWPVVNLAGGFARWREASLELLQGLTEAQRGKILGGNTARFYDLPDAGRGQPGRRGEPAEET